ncbi:MAG TPA: type IV secretion system DNA-binding domain-containing protein [Candidatus Paceibacterota bacterium]|nr:type IV secretion system DNA-binding domain-containing protein [Candidatus Paceibacterota bacterium]
MFDPNRITYFGETDFRGARTKFGIKAIDRTRHMYVIGKTGMGKSTILENMAIQDVQNGDGIVFMDPHGGSADKILDFVPEDRIRDVVYFAPFDSEFPIAFNVLEDVGADKRPLVASGLMSSFKKIWVDAWSARMEYILNNILLALLEYPDATLLGVNRMLSDKDYRKKVVENVTDSSVKAFWVDEFAKYSDKYMQEAGAAIQNKIGQFSTNPLVRNIIGQPRSSFDIRQIMDNSKILIVNLSKGRIGEQNANLLGGMLITKIYLSAMSRADVTPQVLQALPNCYLYVDEFQSFASDSFADILSEARKYKLNLIIAHQYVEQMSEAVRAAVFGNVGSMIIYRVGSFDAQVFEKELAPAFNAEDIVNLGKYQMYLRLMINGVGSKPFSGTGMAPIKETHRSFAKEIIDSSREQFAAPRSQVEENIRSWYDDGKPEKKEFVASEKTFEKPNKPFEKSFKDFDQKKEFIPSTNRFQNTEPRKENFTPRPNQNQNSNYSTLKPAQPWKNNNPKQNPSPVVSNPPIPAQAPIVKQEIIQKPIVKQVTNNTETLVAQPKKEEVKISPSLQKILSTLESDSPSKVELPIVETPKTDIQKPASSFVKKEPTRAITPESSSLLKDALEKALASKKTESTVSPKIETPQTAPVKSPIIEQPKPVTAEEPKTINPIQTPPPTPESQKNEYSLPTPQKDVPEDVLRDLLKTENEPQG